jgi:hypothetical protein
MLFRDAGIAEVLETALEIGVRHPTFEDWWEPFTLGVGPTAEFLDSLDDERLVRLRELCRERLGAAPFAVSARAWAARGVAAA